MADSIKYYKINDFVRLTKNGELDLDESMAFVNKIGTAAAFNTKSNLLVDLRDTTLKSIEFNELLKIAIELSRYQVVYKKRIASIIPDDDHRKLTARQFRSALNVSGIEYDFFLTIEDAIDWLSDIKNLDS